MRRKPRGQDAVGVEEVLVRERREPNRRVVNVGERCSERLDQVAHIAEHWHVGDEADVREQADVAGQLEREVDENRVELQASKVDAALAAFGHAGADALRGVSDERAQRVARLLRLGKAARRRLCLRRRCELQA